MGKRFRFVTMAAFVALTASACAPGPVHPPGAFQHVSDSKVVPAAKWFWSTIAPDGGDVSIALGPFHDVRTYAVTIESVTPIDGDGSVTVAGIDVAGPQRTGIAGTYDVFPPVDAGLGTLVPAKGFVMPADEPLTDAGYDLVIGLKAGGKPRSLINGFHIVYEAEGLQYAYNEPAYLAVCAPPTGASACQPNAGA